MSGYRRLLVAALGGVAWACGDGAAPSNFDPDPLEEQLFDLSNRFLYSSSPFGVGLFQIEFYMGPMDIDTLVGKTMEFVQSPGKFAITTRTGAPPDAARFLLYQGGSNGTFAQPLVEVGYLDMWNQSTAQRRQARVVAVVDGETVADYVAYATGDDASNATWGVTGVAEIAGSRADVDAEGLRQVVNGANRSVSSAEIVLDEAGFRYEGSLEAIWGGSGPWSYTSSTLVDGTGGRVDLDAVEISGDFSGTVRLEDADFATFTGPDRDHPTYSGVGDFVVSAADRSLFDRMVLSRSLPNAPIGLMDVARSFLTPVSIY